MQCALMCTLACMCDQLHVTLCIAVAFIALCVPAYEWVMHMSSVLVSEYALLIFQIVYGVDHSLVACILS